MGTFTQIEDHTTPDVNVLAVVGRSEYEEASELKKQELSDWQDKVMKSIKEGNVQQFAASLFGELGCRITLLEMRVQELERAATKRLINCG